MSFCEKCKVRQSDWVDRLGAISYTVLVFSIGVYFAITLLSNGLLLVNMSISMAFMIIWWIPLGAAAISGIILVLCLVIIEDEKRIYDRSAE